MDFSKSVVEIIRERKSTRTYDATRSIEARKKEALLQCLLEYSGESYRFEFVEKNVQEKGEKLGTYGWIKGARAFIVGIIDASHKDLKRKTIDFGYILEKIILKATDLGLGTCWMVGTYNAKHFLKRLVLEGNERIAIISPLGYSAEKRSIIEKVTRGVAKSDSRKPWEQIFFHGTTKHPLSRSEAGQYEIPLEMVRLAPSAANTQPWRIIKEGDVFNIYLDKDKAYKRFSYNCGYNDIGIAMCHFELSARELGLEGHWAYANRGDLLDVHYEYISSWNIT
jgi:hypothetical protein